MNSWIIVTNLDTADMMTLAVADAAAQEGLPHPPRVLAVSNGSSQDTRRKLEVVYSRMGMEKVLPWWFEPALPSLSGCWNRALDFAWALGAEEVLVTQSDVRLHKSTYEALRQARLMTGALFVSAVGRREGEVDMERPLEKVNLGQRGGPDYSCYLISHEGHEAVRFDENYTPAFLEDLDSHRRFILGGDGDKIFSVDVPYIHYASQTIKTMTPERADQVRAAIDAGSRAYHVRKWGGGANEEKFYEPFGQGTGILPEELAGVESTTSALFDAVRSRW